MRRGRIAEKPADIPKPGWKDILWRVKDEQSKDNLSIVAGGVAFYAILALFPALAAAVSIYGLMADPADVQNLLKSIAGIMPQEAYQIIEGQVNSLVQASGQALGWGALLGIVLAVWSANKGMQALVTSLNIVYDEEESRGFFSLNARTLLLTLCAIVFSLLALTLIVALPGIIGALGLPEAIRVLVAVGRWPLLALFIIVGLSLIYRFAPDRAEPRWRWVTPGSILATIGWVLASLAFSYYVSKFGDYNETYGSMGAIIILMMWFYLTAYLALLGAEVNAEMEHQTRRDTTTGPDRPMGRRDAYVADTVGEKK